MGVEDTGARREQEGVDGLRRKIESFEGELRRRNNEAADSREKIAGLMRNIGYSRERINADEMYIYETFCRIVKDGYNPLTNERDGRYVVVDNRGTILCLSEKAERLFGYEAGTNLDNFLEADGYRGLMDVREERFMDLDIDVRGKRVVMSGTRVNPIMVGNVFLGHVIGFKDVGMFDLMVRGIVTGAKAVGGIGKYLHRSKKPEESSGD